MQFRHIAFLDVHCPPTPPRARCYQSARVLPEYKRHRNVAMARLASASQQVETCDKASQISFLDEISEPAFVAAAWVRGLDRSGLWR